MFNEILIYTDGACSGNPGPGGWAAVIALPEGQIVELGGRKANTTNNDMELTASLRALDYIAERKEKVILYTDSTYVIRGITQWVWAWRSRDWKTAEGKEVLNQEVWKALMRVVGARGKGNIEWKYSRGHTGIAGNERCDQIAVAFSQNKYIELYEGSLLNYSVPVYDTPPDEALPEMRPKTEKKAVYSYLSYVGGSVYRHSDWASCERRVKGQSGAKFKKAHSAAEEKEILKTWGLSESHPIQS